MEQALAADTIFCPDIDPDRSTTKITSRGEAGISLVDGGIKESMAYAVQFLSFFVEAHRPLFSDVCTEVNGSL